MVAPRHHPSIVASLFQHEILPSRITVAGLMVGSLATWGCGNDVTGPSQRPPSLTTVSVVITPGAITLISLGETVQLTASARDSSGGIIAGKTFTWSSTNDSIATVASSGLVTASASGSVTITATTDGIDGTAEVDVKLELLDDLASMYAQLRDQSRGLGAYYVLSEVSSDEMIVPTRGTDWFDNGSWLELHRHTWTAGSGAAVFYVEDAWDEAYAAVAEANRLLDALQRVMTRQLVIEAELRTLRAFFYYMLMDLFGGVPIVTSPGATLAARSTRAELFRFIEDELEAARMDLPDDWPASDYERMTKGAADAILASMYLNAGVFTADAPDATSYNSCLSVQVGAGSACDAAIAAADRILNSGQYSLATEWRSIFAPDNFSSTENILTVKHETLPSQGFLLLAATLHYNQLTPTPWNGLAALAEAYTAFDANDQRREAFLVGPQVNLDTGAPAFDRSGNPLVFTVDIGDETDAGEGEGPRIVKWPPDPNRIAEGHGNDFAWFRLGGILLIKAEAALELGNAGEALGILNTLRERVFEPDEPLTAVDRDTILRERLFELAYEGKRRQDLIRHGRFTEPWSFKLQGTPHLVLMPIPQAEMDTNPLLVQNPGY